MWIAVWKPFPKTFSHYPKKTRRVSEQDREQVQEERETFQKDMQEINVDANQIEEIDVGEIEAGEIKFDDKVKFNPVEHHDKTASKLVIIILSIFTMSFVGHYIISAVLVAYSLQSTADYLSELFEIWLPPPGFTGATVAYYSQERNARVRTITTPASAVWRISKSRTSGLISSTVDLGPPKPYSTFILMMW